MAATPTARAQRGHARRARLVLGWLATLVLAACSASVQPVAEFRDRRDDMRMAVLPDLPANAAVATFAGGCFWCVEADFDRLGGVLATTSGYIGGRGPATYAAVSAGGSGHLEAVRVVYDPARVSYENLLHYFWRHIDPTAVDRQFCDHGAQYRSAIFVHGDAQRRLAQQSRAELERTKPFAGAVATEILEATTFYPAEVYHQDYYLKNPLRYAYYRHACGRDQRVRALWGEQATD